MVRFRYNQFDFGKQTMLGQHQPRYSQQTSAFSPSIALHPSDHPPVLVSRQSLQNINCILEPSTTQGGLFLGDIISTMKQDLLATYQIQAVLTCMAETTPIIISVPCHKKMAIRDVPDYPIISHFDDAIGWIEERRKQRRNVLVHCHAGVSRSGAIVVAYLVRVMGWDPARSLEFVKQRRQRVKPNPGFWAQINEFAAYWRIKYDKTQLKRERGRFSLVQPRIKEIQEATIDKIGINIAAEQKQEQINQTSRTNVKSPQISKKQDLHECLPSHPLHQRRRFFDKGSLFESNIPIHVNNQTATPDFRQKQARSITKMTPFNAKVTFNSVSDATLKQNRSAIQKKSIYQQRSPTLLRKGAQNPSSPCPVLNPFNPLTNIPTHHRYFSFIASSSVHSSLNT